jgi:hypothetical protein
LLEVPVTNHSKFSLAALGGVTLLMLDAPAYAAVSHSAFQASPEQIRRYCDRLDEDFWRAKRSYGCGEKILCMNGECRVHRPLPLYVLRPQDEGGKGGGNGGGRGDNGGRGGQGSSAAGARN